MLLWIYLIGCVVAVLPIARFVLHMDLGPRETPDTGDYVSAILIAMSMTWFWPFIPPGYLVYLMLRSGVPASKADDW